MARGGTLLRQNREETALDICETESAYGAPGQWLRFDPSLAANFVNTSTQSSRFVVGQYYRFHKKRFLYTQFKDAVAYAIGQIVFHDASLGGVVTNDVSEAASATKPQVMGVVLGVQTENYYGFVQTAGRGTVLHNNDDDAAIGDPVIATVADGGVCNVGTWSMTLGVGIGEVAVVTGTNLQQVFIGVGSDPWAA